jgi:GPH family glycoside/pentoside/hexuronide:cation symporter
MTHHAPGVTDGSPKPSEHHVRLREKLAYAAGDIGSNIIYAPATAFILFYLTNVAGIGAAVAGTMLLIGQLLNGVTDIVVGVLLDKTKTRWGKLRPWILFTALPLAVTFVLLFSVPEGLDETGKAIWTVVMYALVMAVFFTASNVAYSALVSVMTPSSKTRVTLGAFRFFAAVATTLVVNALTLPFVDSLGGGQAAWTSVSVIYGAIALITLLTVFFGTRERLAPADDSDSSARRPLGELIRDVVRNRYFLLIAALFLSFYFSNTVAGAAGVYYATAILGDASLYGVLSVALLVPSLFGIAFMPAAISRFGKRRLFLIGIALQVVGVLLPLASPENFTIVVAGLLVRGVGAIPFTAGLYAAVADVVDYGEWRFGVRTDGLVYSSVTFGVKVGGGFGTAVVGWVLAAGGYQADALVQSEAAQQSILALYVYLPVVLTIVAGVIVYFFRIERHRPEIDAYLSRHIDR